MFFHRRALRRPFSLDVGRRGWLLFFILFLIIFITAVFFIEKKIEPMLLAVAKTELKKAAQEAILIGIKEVATTQTAEELMEIEKDRQGKIVMVKINPKSQAKLYSQITGGVQKQLNTLNSKRMKLSLGELIQSPILSGYGPKLPVKLWPKGASKVSLVPKMESAGINMVMVSLSLQVHSELEIVVPFSKETTTVDISYPMGEVMVVGEIPEYYFYHNGEAIKTMPTLPIPNKKEKE